MSALFAVFGRILLGAYFLISGLVKLLAPGPFEAIFTLSGIAPRWVLPIGFLEIIGGVLLALGLMTRATAIVLGAFALFELLVFHNQFTDPTQADTILLHAALIGGLCLVFAHSQIWWSLDSMRQRRRADVVARNAELRAHDAELRAARSSRTVLADGEVVERRRWF